MAFSTPPERSAMRLVMKAGDVMLIELQATGPNGKYVAMQFWPDIFAAIKAAVEKGITVVEAAGNGDENFEMPVFNGTGLQKDSGAIIVGAGVPRPITSILPVSARASVLCFARCSALAHLLFQLRQDRQRPGLGWHVTTLGYGDAQGGASENTWYTLRFSGTSSASRS